jgi:hypothetical protein
MRPFWRGPKHNDQQRSKKEQENYAGISFGVFRLRSSSPPSPYMTYITEPENSHGEQSEWENYRQPSLDDLALAQNINTHTHTRLDQTK